MKKFLSIFLRLKLLSVPYRISIMWRYFSKNFKQGLRWGFKSTENSNFYYNLTDKNIDELIFFVADICNCEYIEISNYIQEISSNLTLKKQINQAFSSNKTMKDSSFGFGRRVGWYAFVRALKPKLIVETGVHHGIGACVLISALEKNAQEGFPGKYLGTDIDSTAGFLLNEQQKKFGSVLIGDSIETLHQIIDTVDLFINDSDHSATYEYSEFETIFPKLSDRALILGDNSHVTKSLLEFSRIRNRSFLLFLEEPKDHWYPGAGIGVSFPRR
jgi:hypothetical protein